MKLKKSFIPYNTGSEALLVPVGGDGFDGFVKGNATFDAILKILKDDVTEAQIVEALKAEFDAPEAVIAGDVKKALGVLRKVGALDG